MTLSTLPILLVEAGIVFPTFYTGYVRDRNGKAIQDVKVSLYSGGSQVSYDYTDSNGYYHVDWLSVSSPYLKIEKTKWVTKTQGVSTAGGSYNFNLYTSSCALIVAGSEDSRFNRDAYLMYNTLIDHYSFSAARIYLITCLSSIGSSAIPRDYATSEYKVKTACNKISSLVNSNDDVVVFWSGHGDKKDPLFGPNYYILDCGPSEITRRELDKYLDYISCKRMLVMIGTCFSGYFIGAEMISNSNRAILTACKDEESSMANSEHSFWDYAIIRALDPDHNATDADVDIDDNKVSLFEFFNFADDYVKSGNPYLIDGINYVQSPQSWFGSSFGDKKSVCLGDQYY